MPMYVVTVQAIVRDVVGREIKIEAATEQEAEQLALEQYKEGQFELEFFDILDSEEPSAFARLSGA